MWPFELFCVGFFLVRILTARQRAWGRQAVDLSGWFPILRQGSCLLGDGAIRYARDSTREPSVRSPA